MSIARFSGEIKDIGDVHHSELSYTDADYQVAGALAHVMGDTYIDFNVESPVTQWAAIAKCLRVHGITIHVGQQ